MNTRPIPQGYDPITLNYYLLFFYKCFTCPPAEFQNLFEQIIKKAKPEFMRIRPYGNIGDRKCDGLLEADGHVFQVYSPDQLKQAEVIEKINEDFDGALQEWGGQMKCWTFVYNTRVGLPPDIPSILNGKRNAHPHIKIESASNDVLWEMLRQLTPQQKAEILGAPNGYEHLFLTPTSSSDEIKEAIKKGWFVVIQDIMTPINLQDVSEAMQPLVAFGLPFYIRPNVSAMGFEEAASYQREMLESLIEKSRDVIPRFALFSFSPIPLCIHLGFILSDRLEVKYFQFDRDRRTWRWPDNAGEVNTEILESGLPNVLNDDPIEVIIRVSLSATISPTATIAAAGNAPVQIDLTIEDPDVMWLKNPEQLFAVKKKFRNVLKVIRNNVPNCTRIHLFYAGPTGGAVVIGQQINPRMNPPIELYQYEHPHHIHALTLKN
jgi:hypothetical protein